MPKVDSGWFRRPPAWTDQRRRWSARAVDPDAPMPAAGLRERLSVTVADGHHRHAWRNGQTDAAVGAAGLAVLQLCRCRDIRQ